MRPRTLHETFAAYRACRLLMDRVLVPHSPEPKPLPGYKNAMDPDLIHAPRVYAPLPSAAGYVAESMLSRQEEEWQSFVEFVNRRVKRLPQYQRDLVRIRYLLKEPLPDDVDAWDRLRVLGHRVSLNDFNAQRELALVGLSKSLRVELEWSYFRDVDQS